ncbi:hypothetical protein FE257_010778 [Aspergillus nanangensis]|uniref:Uncharacterized protein n=1 Tax=Aspergillus nanangensis TaxID=2582783 RepID=A0AAD4CVT9_ASPNN|nr:hypothetical protein FE257_010778 [Aspergillus nanangensis]
MQEVTPKRDLLRARLVNHTFDDQIMTYILSSPVFEREYLGCGRLHAPKDRYQDTYRIKRDSESRWHSFPRCLKMQFLWHRLRQHDPQDEATWSAFSLWFHQLLDRELPRRDITTHAERAALTNQLLNGLAYGQFQPHDMFCRESRISTLQSFAQEGREHWEPFRWLHDVEEARVLLAGDAIQRGDAKGFEELLNQGLLLTDRSRHWHVTPASLAARLADLEFTKVLIRHDRSEGDSIMERNRVSGWAVSLLGNAAVFGRVEVARLLIDYLKKRKPSQKRTDCVMHAVREAAERGNTDMVEFLVDCYGSSQHELLHDALHWALRYCHLEKSRVVMVQRLLRHESFPQTMMNREYAKGLLWSGMNPTKPGVLRALLEGGVDARSFYPGANYTPLQTALRDKDIEAASILIQHGTVMTTRLLSAKAPGKSCPPVLIMAVRLGDAELVQLMLEKGADPTFKWRGKTYFLCQEGDSLDCRIVSG